uniref:Putative ovule protein n=1 Tax=Solanum chacoense TaxID=4108 RepID=A0A0V0GPI6_SOLCH
MRRVSPLCTKHLKYPQKKTLFSFLIRMKQEGWNKPTRSWLKLKPHKYLILVFYQSYPQPHRLKEVPELAWMIQKSPE